MSFYDIRVVGYFSNITAEVTIQDIRDENMHIYPHYIVEFNCLSTISELLGLFSIITAEVLIQDITYENKHVYRNYVVEFRCLSTISELLGISQISQLR